MRSGTAREFLEHISAQDAWVKCRGRFFCINGAWVEFDPKTGKQQRAGIEMYETESDFRTWKADVCSIQKGTLDEVMEAFCTFPIIDGKTFWELENELEW